MASYRQNSSYPSRSNPFEEGEDDFEVIKSAELSRIQNEKQLYEKHMLDSTNRSLRLIEESKEVACKTEEELDRQEESLLRTERHLDKINSDMDVANRHITSLKSIWGTIGNYFRKPPQPKPVPVENETSVRPNPEIGAEGHSKGGFDMGWEESKDVYSSRTTDVNAAIDKSLDGMMSGLTELKGHALLFGETLDRHDDIIERVTYKATVADKKIADSDKQINKILRR